MSCHTVAVPCHVTSCRGLAMSCRLAAVPCHVMPWPWPCHVMSYHAVAVPYLGHLWKGRPLTCVAHRPRACVRPALASSAIVPKRRTRAGQWCQPLSRHAGVCMLSAPSAGLHSILSKPHLYIDMYIYVYIYIYICKYILEQHACTCTCTSTYECACTCQ